MPMSSANSAGVIKADSAITLNFTLKSRIWPFFALMPTPLFIDVH